MQSRFSYLVPTRNREQRTRVPRIHRLLDKTKWRCGYCSCELTTKTVTRDHIVPRAKHGKTCDGNLIASCRDCNQRKADLDLEEYRDLYFSGGVFWFEVVEGAA